MGVPLPPFIFKLSQGSRWGNAHVDALDVGNLRFRAIKPSLRIASYVNWIQPLLQPRFLTRFKIFTRARHFRRIITFVKYPVRLKSVDEI